MKRDKKGKKHNNDNTCQVLSKDEEDTTLIPDINRKDLCEN